MQEIAQYIIAGLQYVKIDIYTCMFGVFGILLIIYGCTKVADALGITRFMEKREFDSDYDSYEKHREKMHDFKKIYARRHPWESTGWSDRGGF